MIIENADEFKVWLTSYLEPLCEADPAALAKYVIALIRKDKSEKDLKTICLDQLEVFLQKETIAFVDTLFETIADKSYLKSQSNQQNDQTQNTKSSLETNQTSSNENSALTKTENASNYDHNKSRDRRNRSRSRSRSRSPFRGNRIREIDNRRGGPSIRNNSVPYYGDDRRNRRGNLARDKLNRKFGYNRDRDYQRRPKRNRSRSRSRSFSSSASSRSRSRSPRTRSKSRSRSKDRESPNNKRSRPSSRSPSPKLPKEHRRCRDYDEQGFCMKGDLCPYDHGNDPVVLDGSVSAALGLAGQNQTNAPQSGLLPLPTQNLPSGPNNYLAEPYNPEAPGLDGHQVIRRGPPIHMRMPHPNHFWHPGMPLRPQLPPGGMPPPFIHPQGRPRELIGVPTVDNGHGNRTVVEPNMQNMMHGMRGQSNRGSHRGHRGGYRNVRKVPGENAEKTVLEVRKIPPKLNNISNLNEHFSKFGTIVNLQVQIENDPEAALVQFSCHSEALAAIRNTEAVLNNRFIKVFWRSKEQQQEFETNDNSSNIPKQQSDDNDAVGNNGSPQNRLSVKERLGPKVDDLSETVTTAVNSAGSISRTVFDPAKLKKTNPSTSNQMKNARISKKAEKSITRIKLKQKKEYQQKLQELLKNSLNEQNKLAKKLDKANEKEKKLIKKLMIESMDRCKKLQEDIRKMQEDIQNIMKPQQQQTAVNVQQNVEEQQPQTQPQPQPASS